MRLGRRGALAGVAAAAALKVSVTGARAVAPPPRRLKMLVGMPEGSGADRMARAFCGVLAPRLPGFELAVTNLPGDGGRTMLAALGDPAGAGSVLGWVSTPTLPARMIDRGDPSLITRIALLGQVAREPIAFVSPANDPADTIQDIIERAAEDADAVPLGTPPAGSAPFLTALRLQALAQTRLNIVTFPSAEAALQAVLAGNVSAAALALPATIGAIRDGNLTAIGIAAHRRFGVLPDAPVLDEAGIPLSAFIRRGLAVPAGTTPELAATLTAAARAAAADDAFVEKALADGHHAGWRDGAAWLSTAEAERKDLAALWTTDPWLSSSGE